MDQIYTMEEGPNTSSTKLRVSVAMATYNGEKFIEEQLLSICRQTRKPDEIVISDDGSKDATMEVVSRVAKSEDAQGIDFVVITDNPRHGFCGNFEWAIKHTTGDVIFLSDQDDVWTSVKVEEMLNVFNKNPGTLFVCHNATLIGKDGTPIEGVFDERLYEGYLNISEGETVRLHRDDYLEVSVSWGGLRGMTFAFTACLKDRCMPFPPCSGFHDKWIMFNAILDDACYYVNLPLALYRLHGNNTGGNTAYRGTALTRIKKIVSRIRHTQPQYLNNLYMGESMLEKLTEKCFTTGSAYAVAKRLVDIGQKQLRAETSGRLSGGIQLCKLFLTDMRYRRAGTGTFLYNLCFILLRSKRTRIDMIGGDVV